MSYAMITFDLKDGKPEHYAAAKELLESFGLKDTWGTRRKHECPYNTFFGELTREVDPTMIRDLLEEAVEEAEGEVTRCLCFKAKEKYIAGRG